MEHQLTMIDNTPMPVSPAPEPYEPFRYVGNPHHTVLGSILHRLGIEIETAYRLLDVNPRTVDKLTDPTRPMPTPLDLIRRLVPVVGLIVDRACVMEYSTTSMPWNPAPCIVLAHRAVLDCLLRGDEMLAATMMAARVGTVGKRWDDEPDWHAMRREDATVRFLRDLRWFSHGHPEAVWDQRLGGIETRLWDVQWTDQWTPFSALQRLAGMSAAETSIALGMPRHEVRMHQRGRVQTSGDVMARMVRMAADAYVAGISPAPGEAGPQEAAMAWLLAGSPERRARLAVDFPEHFVEGRR